MADFNNNPWLAAAIELNELLLLEPEEVQQGQWRLSKKSYPQPDFFNDGECRIAVTDDPYYIPDPDSEGCPDVIHHIPKNTRYAVVVGGSSNEPHYFEQEEDLNDFCRETLIDLGTDFQVYEKADGTWRELDFDPYSLFESIDDTPNPLAHGQLLGRYGGEVDPKILWNIAQGDDKQITLIPSGSKRGQVRNTYLALQKAGAWDEPDFDDELAAWLTEI